jgi:hypothetical protein
VFRSEYVTATTCTANEPFQAVWISAGNSLTSLSEDSTDDILDGLLSSLHITEDFRSLNLDDTLVNSAFESSCIPLDISGAVDLVDEASTPSLGESMASFTATAYFTRTTTSYENNGPSCFAGTELVLLSNGDYVTISEIRVGDMVLAADRAGSHAVFSEVVAVPHDANNLRAVFTKISTKSGTEIKLTPDHLILVQPHCDEFMGSQLMKAGSVKPGMCLMSVQFGSENAPGDTNCSSTFGTALKDSYHSVLDEVTVVRSIETDDGVYTIVTYEEMVVVNGIVASPFAVNHAVAHGYYNVIRVLDSVVVRGVMELSVLKRASVFLGSMAVSFQFCCLCLRAVALICLSIYVFVRLVKNMVLACL